MSKEGFLIEWKNVNYSVALPSSRDWSRAGLSRHKKPLVILNDVSGYAESGKLTVILGPSGCGKTSLLNALASRTRATSGASLTGNVAYDGHLLHTPTGQKFLEQIAFVEQEPATLSTLTVEEAVTFGHSILHVPGPKADRQAKITQGLAEFGLLRLKDSQVGSAFVRGVSGGERRRVSILAELYGDPKLFFLDEPTSGLDSFRAMGVISTLRKYCFRQGRTVVTVIHQPSSAMFQLFDRVIVMAPGGRLVYCGPGGSKLGDHFQSMGYPIPVHYNPADFVVDLMGTNTEQGINALAAVNFEWRSGIEPLREPPPLRLDSSWRKTMIKLVSREVTLILRNPQAILQDFILMWIFTALFSIMFFFTPTGPVQGTIEVQKAFAKVILIEVAFQHFYGLNSMICRTYHMYAREIKGGLYKPYQIVLVQMVVALMYRMMVRFLPDICLFCLSPFNLSFIGYAYHLMTIILVLASVTSFCSFLAYGYQGNEISGSTCFTIAINLLILTAGYYFGKTETNFFAVFIIDYLNPLAIGMELLVYVNTVGKIFTDCFATDCFLTGDSVLIEEVYDSSIGEKLVRFLLFIVNFGGFAIGCATWLGNRYIQIGPRKKKPFRRLWGRLKHSF